MEQIVKKQWGEEHWIVNREYCGKKLLLKKGFRCSIHQHPVKDETFHLQSGLVYLEVAGEGRILRPGGMFGRTGGDGIGAEAQRA